MHLVAKLDPTRVPAGKTYALLDDNRVQQKFKGGTRTSMTIDCVQIDCPGTFGKGVVCWKCKERIKAKEWRKPGGVCPCRFARRSGSLWHQLGRLTICSWREGFMRREIRLVGLVAPPG